MTFRILCEAPSFNRRQSGLKLENVEVGGFRILHLVADGHSEFSQ